MIIVSMFHQWAATRCNHSQSLNITFHRRLQGRCLQTPYAVRLGTLDLLLQSWPQTAMPVMEEREPGLDGDGHGVGDGQGAGNTEVLRILRSRIQQNELGQTPRTYPTAAPSSAGTILMHQEGKNVNIKFELGTGNSGNIWDSLGALKQLIGQALGAQVNGDKISGISDMENLQQSLSDLMAGQEGQAPSVLQISGIGAAVANNSIGSSECVGYAAVGSNGRVWGAKEETERGTKSGAGTEGGSNVVLQHICVEERSLEALYKALHEKTRMGSGDDGGNSVLEMEMQAGGEGELKQGDGQVEGASVVDGSLIDLSALTPADVKGGGVAEGEHTHVMIKLVDESLENGGGRTVVGGEHHTSTAAIDEEDLRYVRALLRRSPFPFFVLVLVRCVCVRARDKEFLYVLTARVSLYGMPA